MRTGRRDDAGARRASRHRARARPRARARGSRGARGSGWAPRRGRAVPPGALHPRARPRRCSPRSCPTCSTRSRRAGALRLDPLARLPAAITDREPRPGDERLVDHDRAAAHARAGVRARRRGAAGRRRPARRRGRPRWSRGAPAGASTSPASATRAGGRCPRTSSSTPWAGARRCPRLLADAGGDPVHEEAADSGFLYYTRFFRAADGRLPVPRAPVISHLGSFSLLTLPADAGDVVGDGLRRLAATGRSSGCATRRAGPRSCAPARCTPTGSTASR